MQRLALVAAVLLTATAATAQSTGLEQRIRDLEIKADSLKKPEIEIPEGTGLQAWFDDGLHLKTGKELDIRIGGYVIAHGVFHFKQNEREAVDTLRIIESHIEVEAKLFEVFEVHVAPNLTDDGSALHDGWVEFNAWDLVRLRAGQFRVPYSGESLEPTPWRDFPADSLTEPQAPGRDIGVMLHGDLLDGIFDYAIGAFNGNGTGFFGGGRDENSDKDVVGYLGISPFASTGWNVLRGFRLGFGGTDGNQRQPMVESTPFELESPAANREYTTDRIAKPVAAPPVVVEGDRQRALGEMSLGLGPLDLKTTYSYSTHDIEIGGDDDVFRAFSNNWSVGWWFGGTREPLHRPKVTKGLFDGGFGALQIVARYSKMHTSNEYLNKGQYLGTNYVKEWAAGVNWYPTRYVRISAMYSRVKYGDEGIATEAYVVPPQPRAGDPAGAVPGSVVVTKSVKEEDVLVIRVQIDF